MDYDVIGNSTSPEGDLVPDTSVSALLHEIAFGVICAAGIIADVLIVHVLRRCKNVRPPASVYIVHWLVSDAVYLLLTPCFYRIFAALEELFVGAQIVCVSFELASLLQTASVTFVALICGHWYVSVFTVRCGRLRRVLIASVWLLALAGAVTFTALCVRQSYTFYSHRVLFVGYALLACVVASMHVTRRLTRHRYEDAHRKLRLNLVLPTTYVLCWAPSWLCLLVAIVVDDYVLLYYLSIGAACLGYMNALVNVYVFTRFNHNFRMCLRQLLRRVHRDYDDAALSADESDESFTHIRVDLRQ